MTNHQNTAQTLTQRYAILKLHGTYPHHTIGKIQDYFLFVYSTKKKLIMNKTLLNQFSINFRRKKSWDLRRSFKLSERKCINVLRSKGKMKMSNSVVLIQM